MCRCDNLRVRTETQIIIRAKIQNRLVPPLHAYFYSLGSRDNAFILIEPRLANCIELGLQIFCQGIFHAIKVQSSSKGDCSCIPVIARERYPRRAVGVGLYKKTLVKVMFAIAELHGCAGKTQAPCAE